MALIIFFAAIILILLVLAYSYYRSVNRTKMIENQLNSDEAEISKLRQVELQLKEEMTMMQNKLSSTFEDQVTKLLGWQLFEDRINQNIKESERYHFTMGLMFVDIDNFKMINDALSYEIGDALLREVARRLEECIRQVDSISRFTKDTFVILLAQLSKPETAAIVAQRILQSLAEPFQINEHELHITVCIGMALYPNDGTDTASLLRNADHALHLAKKVGTNTCRFYEEKMHVQSQRELTIYNSLSKETIFHEFFLTYQPTFNVNNKSILCMDTLLHWQHPELGLIGFQELIDYAEKQHKLNALSGWLLKNACKQFKAWRVAGFNPELLGMPLSIKQLENSNFVYQLSHILQGLEFNPEWLLIEIKENFLHVSLEILEKAFNMLNYLGVKIAIDDFGSGSFTLRYLKTVTINYLKLDISFVDDIVENEKTRALVKSMLALAQTMSMQIIIQGIENEQQMTILKELGCQFMQGPLLSAPLSGTDVINKLAVQTV